MSDRESVHRIIHLFCNNKMSPRATEQFSFWFREKSNQKEKEEAIQKIWEDDRTEFDDGTNEEWRRLYLRIKNTRKIRHPINLSFFFKCVGIILLLIVSTLSYYYAKKQYTSVSIEMDECFVSYGESKDVILPDGTKVIVNQGSVLTYPKNFGGKNMNDRTVFLVGKAYFDVTKQDKPFIVKTANSRTVALGTSFSIQAYPFDSFTKATLEKGSIEVEIPGKGQAVLLNPSEQLTFSHNENRISVETIDLNLYNLEKEGYLIFEDAVFKDIVSALERKYNVIINYQENVIPDMYRYNIKFTPDESLENALMVLQHLTGFKFVTENKF